MKQYDVYGIGNALVDKEFEVDDQFFVDEGIEKGFMTLIDEAQQQALLDQLMQRYELKKKAGGGSAANSLYALSQFGGKAFFSCKVANDEAGHFYMQELGSLNIRTNLSAQREEGVWALPGHGNAGRRAHHADLTGHLPARVGGRTRSAGPGCL